VNGADCRPLEARSERSAGIFKVEMPLRAKRGDVIRRAAPLALMPAAAFAVHQLRYWLAFGGHAGAVLQAQGHSYLHSVVPWILVLVAFAAGIFVRALGRALTGQSSLRRYTVSFAALWLLCAGCLVAIYVAQEFLEGLFVTGHPAGIVGIFGYGGWWSVPASIAVGLVLAACFHGAHWVLHEIASRRRPLRRRSRPVAATRAPRAAMLLRPAPLANGWSGRGPPSPH
jgi:hypothetical protein